MVAHVATLKGFVSSILLVQYSYSKSYSLRAKGVVSLGERTFCGNTWCKTKLIGTMILNSRVTWIRLGPKDNNNK